MNDKYFGAIGDEFGAIGDSFGAEGEGTIKMVALPYIVTLKNNSTSTITNVKLFNSALYCRNTAALNSNITYTVEGFDSYDAFLWQMSSKPITVGRTYWTGSASQVPVVRFTVVNKLADGREQKTPINPEFNKFANQNTVNDDSTPYIVDSNTELILNKLLASEELEIRFYYSETVDIKRMLSGRSTVQQAEVGSQGLVITNK